MHEFNPNAKLGTASNPMQIHHVDARQSSSSVPSYDQAPSRTTRAEWQGAGTTLGRGVFVHNGKIVTSRHEQGKRDNESRPCNLGNRLRPAKQENEGTTSLNSSSSSIHTEVRPRSEKRVDSNSTNASRPLSAVTHAMEFRQQNLDRPVGWYSSTSTRPVGLRSPQSKSRTDLTLPIVSRHIQPKSVPVSTRRDDDDSERFVQRRDTGVRSRTNTLGNQDRTKQLASAVPRSSTSKTSVIESPEPEPYVEDDFGYSSSSSVTQRPPKAGTVTINGVPYHIYFRWTGHVQGIGIIVGSMVVNTHHALLSRLGIPSAHLGGTPVKFVVKSHSSSEFIAKLVLSGVNQFVTTGKDLTFSFTYNGDVTNLFQQQFRQLANGFAYAVNLKGVKDVSAPFPTTDDDEPMTKYLPFNESVLLDSAQLYQAADELRRKGVKATVLLVDNALLVRTSDLHKHASNGVFISDGPLASFSGMFERKGLFWMISRERVRAANLFINDKPVQAYVIRCPPQIARSYKIPYFSDIATGVQVLGAIEQEAIRDDPFFAIKVVHFAIPESKTTEC